MNLSVVELSETSQSPDENQDDLDVQTVHRLVDVYVTSLSMFIPAVVQAGNDTANQQIIERSEMFFTKPASGLFRLIRKPDLIDGGAQTRIGASAKDQNTTKSEAKILPL